MFLNNVSNDSIWHSRESFTYFLAYDTNMIKSLTDFFLSSYLMSYADKYFTSTEFVVADIGCGVGWSSDLFSSLLLESCGVKLDFEVRDGTKSPSGILRKDSTPFFIFRKPFNTSAIAQTTSGLYVRLSSASKESRCIKALLSPVAARESKF